MFLFSYTTPVIRLGYTAASLEVGDLPIVQANMRAAVIFKKMREGMRAPGGMLRRAKSSLGRVGRRDATLDFNEKPKKGLIALLTPRFISHPKPGSGTTLFLHLIRTNSRAFIIEIVLIVLSAGLFYAPAFFLQKVVRSMEIGENDGQGGMGDEAKESRRWAWAYVVGLVGSSAVIYLGMFLSLHPVSSLKLLTPCLQYSVRPALVHRHLYAPGTDEDPAKHNPLREDTSA